MKTPQDRYVKIGKVNTRYWAEGEQGSTLVLIHGLGGYVESWLPGFEALAAQHRVIALDLLGHGRTDKPLDVSYRVADQAEFVKNFMAELGIEHAHVVGHSLGGAVGTRLTLLHPEFVDRLGLVSSAGLGKEAAFSLCILTVPILGELVTRPSRSGSRFFYESMVHDKTVVPDEFVELDYQMTLLPNSQAAFLKALRAVGTLFGQDISMYGPNLEGLPTITKPVMLIWGQQDPVIPIKHMRAAEKSLPNAQVKVLENCGHFPQLEQCQALTEALLEFLKQ